jgi:hypothetical protein
MACLVLVGVGLRFLIAAWSPAQGRHALEITVEVLQHMDEFMADQLAAHLSAHWPLLQADGAQAAVFRPVAGVFTRELGWARDHLHPEALAFAQELFADGGISGAGAARTLGGQGVVRPSCGLYAARKQKA